MGLASGIGLPSLWQLMPHSYGGAAGFDRAINTPSIADAAIQTRGKTETQEQWHPFGRHVLLSDVVRNLCETRRERSRACDGLYTARSAMCRSRKSPGIGRMTCSCT